MPRLRPLCRLLGALLALALPALARAQAEDVSAWEKRHELQRQSLEQSLAAYPALDAKNPFRRAQDLVWIRVEHKELVLRTPLPTTTTPPGFVKVKLAGFGSWAIVRVLEGAPPRKPAVVPQAMALLCNDYSQPLQTTMLSVSGGTEGLLVSQTVQTPRGTDHVQFTQSQPGLARQKGVQLVINRSMASEPPVSLALSAADFFTLVREHPREVGQYLRPVLHKLGQDAVFAPDPMVAWQVFADRWQPDPAVAARVAALLPALDRSDFRERDRAQYELAALGKEGAAVMVRLARAALSPEQNVRLDQVLAPYGQLPAKEAARLRSDREFLLDCLYSDDTSISAAALARLGEVTGSEVAFDLDARLEVRLAAVNALREKLLAGGASTER